MRALLRATGLGEPAGKKSVAEHRIAERHLMIEQAHQHHAELSIERIILEFPGYGYRRVTHALARQDWNVNHKRVLRIMREESLLCHLKKRFVVMTTNSRHGFPVYPNRLADLVLTAPDQAWVAD